jgi:hypothetical protein
MLSTIYSEADRNRNYLELLGKQREFILSRWNLLNCKSISTAESLFSTPTPIRLSVNAGLHVSDLSLSKYC